MSQDSERRQVEIVGICEDLDSKGWYFDILDMYEDRDAPVGAEFRDNIQEIVRPPRIVPIEPKTWI